MDDPSIQKEAETMLGHIEMSISFAEKPPVQMKSSPLRWFILFLACLSCVGSYFSHDLPSALQTPMMKKFHIEVFGFNFLAVVHAVPNVILPFLGGIIIDRIGLRISYALYASFVLVGQVVMTIGISQVSLPMVLIGQGIGALGGETIIVAKSAIIAKWFIGKELSLALGAVVCVAKLGNSACFFFAPRIYYFWTEMDLVLPFTIGSLLCAVSCISVYILTCLDTKAELQRQHFSLNENLPEKFNLRDLKNFKSVYYLLIANSAFLYAGVSCLLQNINNMLWERFGIDGVLAGYLVPLIYICPMFLTPVFGAIGDSKGKRILIILIASLLFLFDHVFIAFLPSGTTENPNYAIIGALVVVAMFYAVYVALFWPCITLLVEQRFIGIAYGLAFSAQNLLLATLPLLLGFIHDKQGEGGYMWTEIILAGVVAIGIFTGLKAHVEDKKTGGRLNNPGTEGEDSSVSRIYSKTSV